MLTFSYDGHGTKRMENEFRAGAAHYYNVFPGQRHHMEKDTERDIRSRLKNLLDLANLQRLQDSFSRATNTASIIADLDGNPITEPSNFSTLCKLAKATPEGQKRCTLSDITRNNKALHTTSPIHHRCGCCGLLDGSAPIFIQDKHVANWLFGQCRDHDISREEIASVAREIGADESAMVAAFEEMPVVDTEQFKSGMELLASITYGLSLLTNRNLSLSKEIQLRKKTENALSESELRFRKMVERNPLGIHMLLSR